DLLDLGPAAPRSLEDVDRPGGTGVGVPGADDDQVALHRDRLAEVRAGRGVAGRELRCVGPGSAPVQIDVRGPDVIGPAVLLPGGDHQEIPLDSEGTAEVVLVLRLGRGDLLVLDPLAAGSPEDVDGPGRREVAHLGETGTDEDSGPLDRD